MRIKAILCIQETEVKIVAQTVMGLNGISVCACSVTKEQRCPEPQDVDKGALVLEFLPEVDQGKHVTFEIQIAIDICFCRRQLVETAQESTVVVNRNSE